MKTENENAAAEGNVSDGTGTGVAPALTKKLTKKKTSKKKTSKKASTKKAPADPKGPVVLGEHTVKLLDPTKIVIREGHNPRFIFTGLEDLAKSLEENGGINLMPITVRKEGNTYTLVDGERRLRATLKAKLPKIRAFVESQASMDDTAALVRALVANDSDPLKPLEEAEAYRKLKEDCNLTLKEISKRVSKSRVHISQRLALLNADESVKQALLAGDITPSAAQFIAKKAATNKDRQKQLVESVKLSGKKGKGAVRESMGQKVGLKNMVDAKQTELANTLRKELGVSNRKQKKLPKNKRPHLVESDSFQGLIDGLMKIVKKDPFLRAVAAAGAVTAFSEVRGRASAKKDPKKKQTARAKSSKKGNR